MIEINLIPDVKRELIKAQQVRSFVISIAIIVAIVAVGLVALLTLYIGAQQWRNYSADNVIKEQQAKLAGDADLSNILTIQNQVAKIKSLHDQKAISSRLFDILTVINPSAPNKVTFNQMGLDTTTGTINLEAQTSGFPALEAFRKTLERTNLSYTSDGKSYSVPLASNLVDGERSYGEDEDGQRVLRFSLSFTYAKELLQRSSHDATIVGPEKRNATDSYNGIPQGLFTYRASDLKEGEGE